MPQAERPPTPAPAGATPEQMAVQICDEYTAIISDEQSSNHRIVERAILVGDKLRYCKGLVAHGNWEQWVKSFCPTISKSTIERWMKLAENKSKIEAEIKNRISKNSTVTFLTLRQALAIANGNGGGGGNTNNQKTPRDRFENAWIKLALPDQEAFVETKYNELAKLMKEVDRKAKEKAA
jgi:Protein of unknown function (DUF3102)